MLKTLGIVQACFSSPHFRGTALRKLGGRSLFESVIRRATDSMQLGGVIVVAFDTDDHDLIHRLVPSDVPIFFGQCEDLLSLFSKALEQYQAEGAVRIRGDNLFLDPGLVDRLVTTAEAHPNCDYVSYCLHDGRPAILSPVGVYAEWFRPSALWRANRAARGVSDRSDATRYIYSHPEQFQLRLIPAPMEFDREDVRLTIDIEEDWEHISAIFDALGDEWSDWRQVARLLDHQPALRRRMAALNRDHDRGTLSRDRAEMASVSE
jgi:spore coat polysaccharide biosynthesis protein SpsF